MRIERFIAAEDRLAEAQGSGEIVDVVIDVAGQHPAVDDDVRAEAVAHLDGHALRVGEDVARTELVGAGQAVALHLVAAIAVGGVGDEGGGSEILATIFGPHAVHRALVARQFGLVDAGLEIAEQRVELRAFEAQIEVAHRCRVEAAVGAVGVDRVIGARVDDAAEARLVLFLVAVIGQGHQPLAKDAALGIERDAAVEILGVEALGNWLHAVVERVVADGPGGKADHGPRAVAGVEPDVELLVARHIVIAEGEIDARRARCGGRFELDVSDANIALDAPVGADAVEAGELERLLGIDRLRGAVGWLHREIADDAMLDRVAVTVGQAHGDDRAVEAVGKQQRLVANDLRAQRTARIMNVAAEFLGDCAIGVADAGDEMVGAWQQLDAAPAGYVEAAVGRSARPIGVQALDGAAIEHKLDGLAGQMLDGDADRWRTRVVIFLGEHPADACGLASEKVGVATGMGRVGLHRRAGRGFDAGDGRHDNICRGLI